jgi:hypothetical protein
MCIAFHFCFVEVIPSLLAAFRLAFHRRLAFVLLTHTPRHHPHHSRFHCIFVHLSCRKVYSHRASHIPQLSNKDHHQSQIRPSNSEQSSTCQTVQTYRRPCYAFSTLLPLYPMHRLAKLLARSLARSLSADACKNCSTRS